MTEIDAHGANKLMQVGKGRTLIIVAATEVVLFLVANIAYGTGNDKHGPMHTVSNVVWVLFLVGFVVLIVFAVVSLAQMIQRRVRRRHQPV
jgi:energy-converting hydrogenase Eha subunit G